MTQIRLVSGKGDFVRRKTDDGEEDVCLCKYNGDISPGCISQVPPYLFEEVVNNKGKYSKETKDEWIKKTGKLPDLRCIYCYDKRKNGRSVEAKDIGEKTRGDFERFRPAFVRLSKETEWGHPLYRGKLLDFLDLSNEFNSRIIFPAKMLEFDEEVAKKILINDGFLSFSIGNDRFERGAVSYGFTNKCRIEQAEKYYSFGVNTALTMVCDVTDSIKNNEERGFNIRRVLDSKVEVKRIIPMRLTSARVALLVTGIERKDLVNPSRGVGHIKGWEKYSPEIQERIMQAPYSKRRNGDLVANFIHPDFMEFENNLRICGQIGEYEYCDKCNLLPDRIKFPVSEIVRVDYTPNKSKLQNKRRKDIPTNRKGAIKQGKTKIPKEKNLKINFDFQE
jgi:hypothetical protein